MITAVYLESGALRFRHGESDTLPGHIRPPVKRSGPCRCAVMPPFVIRRRNVKPLPLGLLASGGTFDELLLPSASEIRCCSKLEISRGKYGMRCLNVTC